MKDLLLSLRLFFKKIKINLLIMVQIVLSILLLLSLVGKLQGIERAKSVTDEIQTKDAVYVYMYDNIVDDLGNAPDEFYGAVQADDSNNTIGEIRNVYCMVQDGNNIPSLTYNEPLIDNVHLKLSAGSWFTNEKSDYIPIISVGNTYKLNDTIKFSMDSQTVREGKIIGIMDKNSYIITFNSGASSGASSLSCLLSKAESCFILPDFSLSEKEKKLYTSGFGKIVFKPENSNIDRLQNTLSEYGAVSNMEDLKRNFADENSQFMIANGTAFLFFLILVLAGVGGNNAIQTIRNEKTFSIYHMLGLSMGKCAKIEAIRGGLLYLFSFVLTLLAFCLPQIRMMFAGGDIYINFFTFLFVFLYLLLIYALTSIVFIRRVSKMNPIDLYRKKD